jgi:hypothetical protein
MLFKKVEKTFFFYYRNYDILEIANKIFRLDTYCVWYRILTIDLIFFLLVNHLILESLFQR